MGIEAGGVITGIKNMTEHARSQNLGKRLGVMAGFNTSDSVMLT